MSSPPTCFVYVVSGAGAIVRAAEAACSVLSLRYQNPGVRAILVCDLVAAEELSACAGDWHRAQFEETKVVCVPEGSPRSVNRRIKISLRERFSGDFVYVDSDFLFVRPFDEALSEVQHVGAVGDFPNGERSLGEFPQELATICSRVGWPFPVVSYWNGGFIVWRDTPEAHNFAARWSELYETGREASDERDQPSLAVTDMLAGGAVSALPWRYNAPVNVSAQFAKRAIAWHYWTSIREALPIARSVLEVMGAALLLGEIDPLDVYAKALRSGYPWATSKGFKSYVAAGAYRCAALELPRAIARFAVVRNRRIDP